MSCSWEFRLEVAALSGQVSVPTTESATRWLTPASAAASRLVVDVSKNSIAAVLEGRRVRDVDDDGGALENLGQTFTREVSTPVDGAAATASWPCSVKACNTFEPTSPVPPITTILMIEPFFDL